MYFNISTFSSTKVFSGETYGKIGFYDLYSIPISAVFQNDKMRVVLVVKLEFAIKLNQESYTTFLIVQEYNKEFLWVPDKRKKNFDMNNTFKYET